jgi:hypothetical protein
VAAALAKRKWKLWLVLGEKFQSQGRRLLVVVVFFFFFFVKIGKILGLPMCHPFKILRSSID